MTTKHLFLSMALCAGLNLANASSSSGSSANNSPSFEYQDQVFKRYAASNLDESLPSLAQLYQDAKSRKTHLDSLFSYLETHKTTEPTLNLFHGIISYSQYLRQRHCPTQEVPQDIHLLSFFKNDYAVERDLMTYFVNALEKMATTPPTQARIEELYAQTVQTTRLNLQSLSNRIFDALSRRHPLVFQHEVIFGDHMKITDDVLLEKIKGNFSEEERAFFKFTKELGSGRIDMFEVDTVEITRHLRDLFKIKNITFDDVCFDLNSLSFYLNLERALLAASSSLRFEPHKFGFDKGPSALKDRFILSALQDYHQKGLLSNMGSRFYNATELALLRRSKDKLLALMLKDEASQAIDTMLAKLGAGLPSAALEGAPASNKTTAKKGKVGGKKSSKKQKEKKDTKKKGTISQTKKAEVAPAPEPNPLLLAQEEWDIDESQGAPVDAEQADSSSDEDEEAHTGAPATRSYLG
ncbi:MAG: hypothetical protein LCH26_08215, partial [Proteobacteria bacterium]|nr:hypothetical protein [Pseudomonadota bacterium]